MTRSGAGAADAKDGGEAGDDPEEVGQARPRTPEMKEIADWSKDFQKGRRRWPPPASLALPARADGDIRRAHEK